MRLAVDSKVGIIRSAHFAKVFDDEPRIFLCYAEPADISDLAGIEGSNQGGACATTAERAFLRACGEAVERYCSSFVDDSHLIVSTERDLLNANVAYYPARAFYPLAESQYGGDCPFDKPNLDAGTKWIPSYSHRDEKVVLVPASCVFVPYRFDRRVENFSHMSISTGLACGPDCDFAFKKGILEILERDALMIVWHRRLPTVKIDAQSCRGRVEDIDLLLDAAPLANAQWHINLLTVDIDVPIVSAVLVDRAGRPKTSFGVAADEDPAVAILKALEEALLSRLLLNRLSLNEISRNVQGSPRTLQAHMLLHAVSKDSRRMLKFLTEAAISVPFDQIAARWKDGADDNQLFNQLKANGFDFLSVDVTTPDVLDLGLRVVRALLPGAQPLDNDDFHKYIAGARLRTVPEKLGFDEAILPWNSDPHPFP